MTEGSKNSSRNVKTQASPNRKSLIVSKRWMASKSTTVKIRSAQISMCHTPVERMILIISAAGLFRRHYRFNRHPIRMIINILPLAKNYPSNLFSTENAMNARHWKAIRALAIYWNCGITIPTILRIQTISVKPSITTPGHYKRNGKTKTGTVRWLCKASRLAWMIRTNRFWG